MLQLHRQFVGAGCKSDSSYGEMPTTSRKSKGPWQTLSSEYITYRLSTSVGPDSWLRRFGFYGTFATKSCARHLMTACISLGFSFPAWLWAKSFGFEFFFCLPGHIKMQNRVDLQSPFLSACKAGDLRLIRQHLADRSGSVTDRSLCTGQTPLLVCGSSGWNRRYNSDAGAMLTGSIVSTYLARHRGRSS